MHIMLNGEEQSYDRALTVAELLDELGLAEEKVAVEQNLAIVPRSVFTNTMVSNGDTIEIVHFIGGG